jgi:hypothetical protein
VFVKLHPLSPSNKYNNKKCRKTTEPDHPTGTNFRMATAINEQEGRNVENNEEKEVPDWMLAKRGLKMLINNNAKDAQELFTRYPDSLPMCAGYSFAAFMVVASLVLQVIAVGGFRMP